MTTDNYKIKYNEACLRISERKLKPAFDLLKTMFEDNNLQVFSDEYRNLDQTYHYMLKYTMEGIDDPERQKVYQKLIISVYQLADKIYDSLNLKFSSSVEFEKMRSAPHLMNFDTSSFLKLLDSFYEKMDLATLMSETGDINQELQKETDTLHKDTLNLFYYYWFQNSYSVSDLELFRNLLAHESFPVPYKGLLISALSLSLLKYFDEKKFILLFEAFSSEKEEVNLRALVALLLNGYKYDSRLKFFPELIARIKLLNEEPVFRTNIENVIIQLIRSKETEKIQQKIKDEIIPEMIKISPNLKDKINLDRLMNEGLQEDKNPDWEDILKDSPGLFDKMEEFSKLQTEGADVFIGSFSMLKSFPFFEETANWFMPFYIENPDIAKSVESSDQVFEQFINIIDKTPFLCNSDKYSFCFSINHLPPENREFMSKGMAAEMNEFVALEKEEELTDPAKKGSFISNRYIQDLYRYYKLYPKRGGQEDIFKWRFDFFNTNSLSSVIKENLQLMRNIGEYYFIKNHYSEASEIYEYLISVEKSVELFQKVAFCYQKSGDFKKALDYYLKADLYDLNKLWNSKKIALCYRNLKQPIAALEYYRQAEKIDSEDLNVQLQIGQCLLELEKFDEALQCYFRIEYLAPGNKNVWRPIAWCSFVTGKIEQAEKYLEKLIQEEPTKHDFMNMGHVQWSLGKRKQALEFYQKSINEGGFEITEFFNVFDDDLQYILEQGIYADDVPIMLDQLRYLIDG